MTLPFRVLISIVTYQRPNGLKRLLIALQNQKIGSDVYVEILVVDNDCAGENPKVLAELQPTAPIKLNLVEAPEKGIVSARNMAVCFFLQSPFHSLIFIDDDEWPCETNWLQTLVNTQIQTKADLVTSLVHVIAENPLRQWVEKVFCFGNHIKPKLAPTNRFYTDNLLIMRPVLETITPAFDLRFTLTGSEDLHFCIRCQQAGFKAIFTPDAPIKEYYPDSRTKLRWFFLRGYRSGEGATRATIYENSLPAAYFTCMLMFCFRLIRSIYSGFIGATTLNKALIARSILQVGSAFGTMGGLVGLSYQEYKTTHGS